MSSALENTCKVSTSLTWIFQDVRSSSVKQLWMSSSYLCFKDFGFAEGDQKWSIKLAPSPAGPSAAKKDSEAKFFGLFLRLDEAPPETKVKVTQATFTVFMPACGSWKVLEGPGEYVFNGDGFFGRLKAVSYANLLAQSSEYLCGDALTVRVEFHFEVDYSLQSNFRHNRRMEKMYDSKDLADVDFITSDGKELRAHQFVLTANSPVFRCMFTKDTAEKRSGRVELRDVDYETLDAVLRFVYSGEVANVTEIAEKVLEAADKYCFFELRSFAIKLLSVNFTFETAPRLMAVAAQRDLPDLGKAAARFLFSNLKVFRLTEEYRRLKLENGQLFSFMEIVNEEVSLTVETESPLGRKRSRRL